LYVRLYSVFVTVPVGSLPLEFEPPEPPLLELLLEDPASARARLPTTLKSE
jgi:hypothetical protein